MKRSEHPDNITAYMKGKIREVLVYKRVSLTELALQLEMEESQLSRFMRRSHHMMTETLLRLANGLAAVYHVEIDLNQFITKPQQKP
jgi:DNA-binding Xre family transcriptional regulator